ncbi:hypothetical protein QBC37DRAFT_430048 [Rhypophila decipiens]|uniref:Uncharacterized protein n=1 Tax=Rhypophila decipiens TaxID=261697 RepID=A0AAN6XZ86_9PEZI|nr:hypothetical protein QBC37DRAFT_430048 [Rhypophila decipiens]
MCSTCTWPRGRSMWWFLGLFRQVGTKSRFCRESSGLRRQTIPTIRSAHTVGWWPSGFGLKRGYISQKLES